MAGKGHRICVFCGEKPANKNLEHVIPEWLIKETIGLGRMIPMGENPYTGAELSDRPAKNLRYPACTACNDEFGKNLETPIAPIFRKIVYGGAASALEYHLLLDWLDKVRVGLWLRKYYDYENAQGVKPKFAIASRMGLYDRAIAIYRFPDHKNTLFDFGTDTLFFHSAPMCFGLLANQILLVSISAVYLLSENLGFPYPAYTYHDLDIDRLRSVDLKANFRIATPILNGVNFLRPSILLYQPMIPRDSVNRSGAPDHYASSYVQEHLLGPRISKYDAISDNAGVLFQQIGRQVAPIYDPLQEIPFQPVKKSDGSPLWKLGALIYDLQAYMIKEAPIANSQDSKKLRNHLERRDGMITQCNSYIDALEERFRGSYKRFNTNFSVKQGYGGNE